jgi:predicted HAD superfamily Cof-like phosphohydrolase
MSHFQCVGKFHDTFGHPQRTEPYINVNEMEPKLVPFRISLIKEELEEFDNALENFVFHGRSDGDLVEMADALCDTLYVAYGTGHCLGINLDSVLAELKLSIINSVNLDTKVIHNIVEENPEMLYDNLEDVTSVFELFISAYEENNFNNMKQYLANLIHDVYNYGYKLGFNMDLMFREVHSSNMSKVCVTIEEAEESIRRYKIEGRYSNPTVRVKNNYYVVYDATTSKILKNYKWRKPDLAQFM